MKIAIENNIQSKKYLARMANGRYIGVYKLESGFNDSRCTFRIGQTRNTIVLREKYGTKGNPDPMESASTILKRHGFNAGSATIIDLQAAIDKTIERDSGKEHKDTTIFQIPEECEPVFVDMGGAPINQVFFSNHDDGTEWAYFWLDSKKKKADAMSDATPNRDKKRSKEAADLQNIADQYKHQMEKAYREKKEMQDEFNRMYAQFQALQAKVDSNPQPMDDDQDL